MKARVSNTIHLSKTSRRSHNVIYTFIISSIFCHWSSSTSSCCHIQKGLNDLNFKNTIFLPKVQDTDYFTLSKQKQTSMLNTAFLIHKLQIHLFFFFLNIEKKGLISIVVQQNWAHLLNNPLCCHTGQQDLAYGKDTTCQLIIPLYHFSKAVLSHHKIQVW